MEPLWPLSATQWGQLGHKCLTRDLELPFLRSVRRLLHLAKRLWGQLGHKCLTRDLELPFLRSVPQWWGL